MTQAVAGILQEVEQLSPPERADLADRLIQTLAGDLPPEIGEAQLGEVHRRIAQVGSGEAIVVPGETALAKVRELVASARRPRE